jgi:hypothetical protein
MHYNIMGMNEEFQAENQKCPKTHIVGHVYHKVEFKLEFYFYIC